MSLTVVGIVFGVVFVAELPDKSLFASLVLGTRYRAWWVWSGVAAAFLVHVVLAVAAGQALTLLSPRLVDALVALLFLAGAGYLLLARDHEHAAGESPPTAGPSSGFRRVAATSFGVVFLGEWGDVTQITTANYAARYAEPVAVAIGAVAALWAVAALAVTAGSALLDRVPVRLVRRVAGLVLVGFGVVSAYTAAVG